MMEASRYIFILEHLLNYQSGQQRCGRQVSDPELQVRHQAGEPEINVNMAALNYILHTEIGLDKVVSDQPMHSLYKKCARS